MQFDSFTGKCSFRANTAAKKQSYSFDYDVNTLITAGDGSTDCPILDRFVQDDHVAMYITYDYDTTLGGTATAVLASVERIRLLPKTEY